MAKISDIEGIGPVNAGKLTEAGVPTVERLLENGASKKARKALADATGIGETSILRWVNMADLFRIKGVGEEYADLLECAGVDTVPELAQRNGENLHTKLLEVNREKKLVRAVPNANQVTGWVTQAKDLPRLVTH